MISDFVFMDGILISFIDFLSTCDKTALCEGFLPMNFRLKISFSISKHALQKVLKRE